MKKPEPKEGLVIRYDFLWHDEAKQGREEGSKDRPCVIVLASQKNEQGKETVLLAPITHTPPTHKSEAVEIPHKVARHLGLDDDRQWIKTTEINRTSWDDAGIVPAKTNQWEYGRLPKALTEQIKNSTKQAAELKKVQLVKRAVEEELSKKPSKEQTARRDFGRGQGRDSD